jgi:hypothetical protein
MLIKGEDCGLPKYLWGRTVRAKALTLFLQYGAYIVRHALPHLTRNAAERRSYNRHPLGETNEKGEAMSANNGSTLESQGIKF